MKLTKAPSHDENTFLAWPICGYSESGSGTPLALHIYRTKWQAYWISAFIHRMINQTIAVITLYDFNPRAAKGHPWVSSARSQAFFPDDKAAEAWLAERLEEPGLWLMEAIL